MNTTQSIIVPHEISKILQDLNKLEQIGKITALEIELDGDVEFLDEIVTYTQGIGGLIYSLHSLYVNYHELGRDGLRNFLWEMSMSTDWDIIEGILVQLQLNYKTEKIALSIEIDRRTQLPRMISTSQPSRYYEILEHFKLAWFLLSRSQQE